MTLKSILGHVKNHTFKRRVKEKKDEVISEWIRNHADRFPIKNNKIVFDNFAGRGFADHPRYIAEEIHRRGLDWEMVWLVNDLNEAMPPWIKKVRFGSWQSVYELTTAKMWVDNIRNAHLVPKKEGQVYLQTWHGSMPFKLIEKEAENLLHPDYIKLAQYDGSITDAILSSSKWQSKQFIESFWLNANTEILEFGGPRCDQLFDESYVEITNQKVRKKLHIKMNEYVVLYAPTFRDDDNTKPYNLDFRAIRDAFVEKTGKPCIIIIRLHPNVNSFNLFSFNEWMIDGSKIKDSNDLVICADSIISDFSSILYEASLLKKVSFRCAVDYEVYIKQRPLLPLEKEMPFLLSDNVDELLEQIKSVDFRKYTYSIKRFLEKMEVFEDGRASYKTVDWLKKKIA